MTIKQILYKVNCLCKEFTLYQKLSEKSQPNGYASLDENGIVPLSELPNLSGQNNNFKGIYTTLQLLQITYPIANIGDYAQVDNGITTELITYYFDMDNGWVLGNSATNLQNLDGVLLTGNKSEEKAIVGSLNILKTDMLVNGIKEAISVGGDMNKTQNNFILSVGGILEKKKTKTIVSNSNADNTISKTALEQNSNGELIFYENYDTNSLISHTFQIQGGQQDTNWILPYELNTPKVASRKYVLNNTMLKEVYDVNTNGQSGVIYIDTDINSNTFQKCFIWENSEYLLIVDKNKYLKLTGTDIDLFTGDIQLNKDWDNNKFKLFAIIQRENENNLTIDKTGIFIESFDISNTFYNKIAVSDIDTYMICQNLENNVYTKIICNSENILVDSNNTSSSGINGSLDFSTYYNNLSYVQKIYVDNIISTLPSTNIDIKTLYENNSNTNCFTDLEKQLLQNHDNQISNKENLINRQNSFTGWETSNNVYPSIGAVTTYYTNTKIKNILGISGTIVETNQLPIKIFFTATGTAQTIFTVSIGKTMLNTNYVVSYPMASNMLSSVNWRVENKTTTNFQIISTTGLTGAVAVEITVTP